MWHCGGGNVRLAEPAEAHSVSLLLLAGSLLDNSSLAGILGRFWPFFFIKAENNGCL